MARKSRRSSAGFSHCLVAVLALRASGIAGGRDHVVESQCILLRQSNRVVHFSPKGRCDAARRTFRLGDGSNGARGRRHTRVIPACVFVKVTSLPSSANAESPPPSRPPARRVTWSSAAAPRAQQASPSAAVGTNDAWQVTYVSSGSPVTRSPSACRERCLRSRHLPRRRVVPTTTIAPTTTPTCSKPFERNTRRGPAVPLTEACTTSDPPSPSQPIVT